jgi:hypothetical protein
MYLPYLRSRNYKSRRSNELTISFMKNNFNLKKAIKGNFKRKSKISEESSGNKESVISQSSMKRRK